MSYEKTLNWEYGQEIDIIYTTGQNELILEGWGLYKGLGRIIPDRDTSAEIEELVANWLTLEYNKNSWNYHMEFQDAILEKSWEASRGR